MSPLARILLPLAILGSLAAASCGGNDADSHEPTILAGNSIVADWVANIAGDRMTVDTIVPQGANPHTYQLSPSAIRKIASADVLFLIGSGLEQSFEDVITENATGSVIRLSEGLDLAPLEAEGSDESGQPDPHIWMNPDLAIAAVGRIATELRTIDPDGAATYTANAATYTEALRTMDMEVAAKLAPLTPQQRLLVTFHDAYGYFAARYDLTILGFVVENPDEEPSASRIADLVDEIRARGAVAIYKEPQYSARVVDQVANEAGIPIRTLPSDTLTDDWPTYIEMMHAMADSIAGS